MGDNRKLSVHELFKVLQEEYVICKLRAHIYPIQHHKEFWDKTAEGKKEKIESIALRNHLQSLFTNEDIEAQIIRQVYAELGPPKFYYPNKKKESKQRYWDLINYYCKGADVRFKEQLTQEQFQIGVIRDYRYDDSVVTIDTKEGIVSLAQEQVARIL